MTGQKEGAREIAQFVCFKLANEEYGIDINCVQEVIRPQEITPLPQLPDFALGVMNVRGSVAPVFDLRKKLNLEQKKSDEHSRIVLVQLNGMLSSFLVDEVLDNIKIDSAKIDATPEVRMSVPKECVRGLGVVDKRMIVILDHATIDRAIQADINACLAGGRPGHG
jgi:purine-binding chemotaxis protein CheW